ncbi:HD domain-containing protein [Nevskia sp.]|uniref:HD domain-containing protein n=1 Tax=Nevskia sp. TaxID=1929292 RepID=UPI0025E785DC|nr:HD domain-containing protein [Nevskia sp.]
MQSRRRNHYDVTNQVCIADPLDVQGEVTRLLSRHNPQLDPTILSLAFRRFTELHAGVLPGYAAADTPYHDAQHSLDCTLGTARLIDGHTREGPESERISPRRALLGVLIALFHDTGYIRRSGDRAGNGAAYTLSHVQRSGEFLERILPSLGFAAEARLAAKLVHFTGYEMPLDAIDVHDPADRALGFMIASSDLIVQTADRCYLEKCRDFLYPEFEVAGLAGAPRPDGPQPLYADRDTLMRGTPEFNARLWEDRLDGYFGGIHRYFGVHFEGRYGAANPYTDAIQSNLRRVKLAIRRGRFDELRLRPRAIDASCMRYALGLPADLRAAA